MVKATQNTRINTLEITEGHTSPACNASFNENGSITISSKSPLHEGESTTYILSHQETLALIRLFKRLRLYELDEIMSHPHDTSGSESD